MYTESPPRALAFTGVDIGAWREDAHQTHADHQELLHTELIWCSLSAVSVASESQLSEEMLCAVSCAVIYCVECTHSYYCSHKSVSTKSVLLKPRGIKTTSALENHLCSSRLNQYLL